MAENSSDSVALTGSPRIFYLDSLRVLAVLLVFLYHSVHPFDESYWHIKNVEQSVVLTIALGFFSTWGMSFFFMVAGAGSWLALRRRSPGQFASERTRRLLVPFVIGVLTLTPLMKYLEWVHWRTKSTLPDTFWGYLTSYFPGLGPAVFGWLGYHLWFLGFLFSFSILCLPVMVWLRAEGGKRLAARLGDLAEHRGGMLLAIVPPAIAEMLLRPYAQAQHDWVDFFFQMIFFLYGYVLLSDERIARGIRRDGRLHLGLGVALFLLVMGLFATGQFESITQARSGPSFIFTSFIVAMSAWTWSTATLAFGMNVMDRASAWVKYGNEAVLPFYAIHQPVVMLVAFFVVQWQAGLLVKLPVVVVGSFVVCVLLYEYAIRRVPLLRAALGMPPMPAQRESVQVADGSVA